MAQTQSEILTEMLGQIRGDFDTSAGSIACDLQIPSSIQLEKLYSKLDKVDQGRSFLTATCEDLDKKAAEQGLHRKIGTKARGQVKIIGTEGADVKKGDLVAAGNITFMIDQTATISTSGEVVVSAICNRIGAEGNVLSGSINRFPVTIPGLISVTNEQPFFGGYDTETDDELRDRCTDYLYRPVTSGNVAYYEMLAKEITGVGEVKVTPLWAGNGTVKVSIIDSNHQPALDDLIQEVQQHIDENRVIGAAVTITTAARKEINVNSQIVYNDGVDPEIVKEQITKNISQYLKGIAFSAGYVSIAKVGQIILNTEGVYDYNTLQINGQTWNISIGEDEVAVLGKFN